MRIFEINFMQFELPLISNDKFAAFRGLLQLSPLVHKHLRAAYKFKNVKKYSQLPPGIDYASLQKLMYMDSYAIDTTSELVAIEIDRIFQYIYDQFAEFPLACLIVNCDKYDTKSLVGNIHNVGLYTQWFNLMTNFVKLLYGDIIKDITWGIFDPSNIIEHPHPRSVLKAIDTYNAKQLSELKTNADAITAEQKDALKATRDQIDLIIQTKIQSDDSNLRAYPIAKKNKKGKQIFLPAPGSIPTFS